jgi:NAD(P)H-hydrate repair Nnr-like enzyme with NAD(P)H-hydrate dehydratase domain
MGDLLTGIIASLRAQGLAPSMPPPLARCCTRWPAMRCRRRRARPASY